MDPAARRLALDVQPLPERVGPARAAVYDFLQGHGVPEPVAADMRLVTSELLTNAIVHGREPIGVAVDVEPPTVVLCVEDGSPVSAIPPVADWRMADATAPSGRGLGLVASLCDHVDLRGDAHVARVICRRSWPADGSHG